MGIRNEFEIFHFNIKFTQIRNFECINFELEIRTQSAEAPHSRKAALPKQIGRRSRKRSHSSGNLSIWSTTLLKLTKKTAKVSKWPRKTWKTSAKFPSRWKICQTGGMISCLEVIHSPYGTASDRFFSSRRQRRT